MEGRNFHSLAEHVFYYILVYSIHENATIDNIRRFSPRLPSRRDCEADQRYPCNIKTQAVARPGIDSLPRDVTHKNALFQLHITPTASYKA